MSEPNVNNSVIWSSNTSEPTNDSNLTFRNLSLDFSSICVTSQGSMWFNVLVGVMYSVVLIVALSGNGLVCWVVHSTPRMKTVTNYYITNLAVGDILLSLFCVPFSSVSTLVLRAWVFGGLMCRLVNYAQAVSVLVTAFTLLAISADRYVAVTRPLRPRLGRSGARAALATVWAVAFVTAAPIAYVSTLQRPTEWHQFCQVDLCLEQWPSPASNHEYTCALLVLQFVLPLSALAGTYARIACVVDKRPPGEAHSARDHRLQRAKRKMVKMMVAVVVVFTACWLPLNILIVLWSIHETDEDWNTWPGMPYVWFVSHWLAMSHSCYNPVIYCYMNARYRRGFKQTLSCCLGVHLGMSPEASNMCNGIPISEMIGVNGSARRGTTSTTEPVHHQLQRAPTCSSYTSERRTRTGTPPVRTLSVRYT